MSGKHTPGPWAIEEEPYRHIRAKDGSQDGWGSTVLAGDYPPSLKDAQLIAAVPDMLEALERIANHTADVTGAPQMVAIARAAIAKATS